LHGGFSYLRASTPEDMVQDAILKFLENKTPDKPQNIEALLITILKNLCIDYGRLKKNAIPQDYFTCEAIKNTATESPEEIFEKVEKIQTIKKKMTELPLQQQIAIRLRDFMGYEFNEIGKIMNISEGNVRVILARGRKTLRELL
jgi:RNA polymerase sigma factor, sigma-70 family